MPLTRPIIVEELKQKLGDLRRRWQNRRLIGVFAHQVDDLAKDNAPESSLKKVLDVVDQVQRNMPPLKDNDEIDEESLVKHEVGSRILRSGIDNLHRISSNGSEDESQKAAIDKATRRDDRDIKQAFESNAAASLRPSTVSLKIFDMDHPDIPPRSIEASLSCYNEVMWFLVSEASHEARRRREKFDFYPELWLRRDNGHTFGGRGRCWDYVQGTTTIDEKHQAIDVVNVAHRRDYIVAAVHEGDKEIPVPIDVPRCGSPECLTLKEYLLNCWQSRQILLARRISEPQACNVLATALDTSLFPSRTNDLYIRCSTVT